MSYREKNYYLEDMSEENMLRTKYKFTNLIMVYIYVLYLLWELTPYFTWNTYKNGLLGYFFGIPYQYIFAALAIIVYFIGSPKIKLKKTEKYLIIGILALGIFHIVICGFNISNIASVVWIRYIMTALYIMLPIELKKKIFDTYRIVFAISLVPGIIYSILSIMSINVPHDFLESIETIKQDRNYSYIHYPLAVQLYHNYGWDSLSLYRLCGIYNEAGLVGTLCALFLVADKYRIKNRWENTVLLVSGTLSFSLAFYLMLGVYFVLINIGKHKFKNAMSLVGVIFAIIVFLNMDFDNPALSEIQSRLQIADGELVGDNRTNSRFDKLFDEIYDDPVAIIVGYGMGSIGTIQRRFLIDGSSYKCLIYDYGYLGVGVFIIWLYFLAHTQKGTKWSPNIVVLFVIYLLNIYQRPSMFYPSYLIIFIGGVYCMNLPDSSLQNGTHRRIRIML